MHFEFRKLIFLSNHLVGAESSRSTNERYEEYKATAAHVAGRVGEKASELKSAASDWFSQFTKQEAGADDNW